MDTVQEKTNLIYIGYHPRTHDGSSPRSRSFNESVAIKDEFNKKQEKGGLQAEVVDVAFTDLCAVVVMEPKIGKVWQYL